jgi:hypothetical protein
VKKIGRHTQLALVRRVDTVNPTATIAVSGSKRLLAM